MVIMIIMMIIIMIMIIKMMIPMTLILMARKLTTVMGSASLNVSPYVMLFVRSLDDTQCDCYPQYY